MLKRRAFNENSEHPSKAQQDRKSAQQNCLCFSIIGFCGCIIGMISMALGAPTLKIGAITLHGLLGKEAAGADGMVYASLAAGMILCVGEAALSGFAAHYFKRELAEGTPFCLDGAKEMLRLGILTICIPIGTQILTEIVCAVLEMHAQGVVPFSADSSVALGVMFIFTLLICRYGAALWEEKDAQTMR